MHEQFGRFLVRLHGEKAFDKIRHEGLFNAMERIRIIKSLYENSCFKAEIHGESSNAYKQTAGI